MATSDDKARAELRARQGAGARYDASAAPAADLLLARRGTAYFARKLMELNDQELYQPAAISGLSRAHIVAKVSYEARLHALALDALIQSHTPDQDPLPDIELAVTLPARALRHLFRHSEVHLNVCWRDLKSDQWAEPVTLDDDRRVLASALPILRANTIWRSALELGNGGRESDLPEQIRLSLSGS